MSSHETDIEPLVAEARLLGIVDRHKIEEYVLDRFPKSLLEQAQQSLNQADLRPKGASPKPIRFKVDTHLFQELGELLVGRDSTALAELIKNAYDADAKSVQVHGAYLTRPEQGRITIQDDGIGMNADQFETGFLTIASRYKRSDTVRSAIYRRRYTGAKGIGRLAAHKLAHLLFIESLETTRLNPNPKFLRAAINWDQLEEAEDLDDEIAKDAVHWTLSAPKTATPGTQISLVKLRRAWTMPELVSFCNEVNSYQVPEILLTVPKDIVARPLLDTVVARQTTGADPGFRISLSGDFEVGQEYWENLVTTADWLVEIDALSKNEKGQRIVRYKVSPTKTGSESDARSDQAEILHPSPHEGPFFQSRIYIRSGKKSSADKAAWLAATRGIRVYLEGFRVLPYGEEGDDWLDLERDYKRRSRALESIGAKTFGTPARDEGLSRFGTDSFYGAVFLTAAHSSGLKMLVNREGFIPSKAFEDLKDLVKKGVEFATRVKARHTAPERAERKIDREEKAAERVANRKELREAVEGAVTDAERKAAQARIAASEGKIDVAVTLIKDAADSFASGSEINERLLSERQTMFVLASVGTQMGAFVHDMIGLIGTCHAVEKALNRVLSEEKSISPMNADRLYKQIEAIADVRRGLEKQSSYFADVVSVDARRRRARLGVRERFDAVSALLERAAERQGIVIKNQIHENLRTPPMFTPELTALLTNLLSNALKAAKKKGVVLARSRGEHAFVIENTGTSVDLRTSEELFKPFVSKSMTLDPILGQGMGMGLPIVRNIVGEYGGTVRFVQPSSGYSTAIEVKF